jgi:hypothetical protein
MYFYMLIGTIYKSSDPSLEAPDFSLFSMEEELQYIATFDSGGHPFEGSKAYIFHLPANIPAGNFWSVLVYDCQTRLILANDQCWPSIYSNSHNLKVNLDSSVDIWFGPEVPPGKEYNWIKTIPGKGWNLILRLYYPTERWFDKSWRPGEVEEVR